jgi:hypothetical protein
MIIYLTTFYQPYTLYTIEWQDNYAILIDNIVEGNDRGIF